MCRVMFIFTFDFFSFPIVCKECVQSVSLINKRCGYDPLILQVDPPVAKLITVVINQSLNTIIH